MSTVFSQNTDDLSDASRSSLEAILGQPLPPHQRVTIVVESPAAGAPQGTREQAAARIRELLASTPVPTATDEDIDEALEQAMSATRRRA